MKKHPVRTAVLAVILAIALSLGGVLLVNAISANDAASRMRRHLTLGVQYLNEMDYESALASFDIVLQIDQRNVPARIGSMLAYAGMGDDAQMMRVLNDGANATDDALLRYLIAIEQEDPDGEDPSGRGIRSIEESTESWESAAPFDTLRIIGSNYYEWDVSSFAKMMGVDPEENDGQRVEFGSYYDMDLTLDMTAGDPRFQMLSADYLYEYQMLQQSEVQLFSLACFGDAAKVPGVTEVACDLAMGTTYADVLAQLGLPQPKRGTYTLVDSSAGFIGYTEWEQDGTRNLILHLSAGRPLSLHLQFVGDRLTGASYSCDLPHNVRSGLLNLIAQFF